MDTEFVDLVNPSHTALIVIDVQNDSCHPDGVYAKAGLDISLRRQAGHNAAALVDDARAFGVPVIFTKASHTAWDRSPARRRQQKSERHTACQAGTWGEELYLVSPREGEHVITKRRYSAFIGTDLDLVLRSKRITTLILTGGGTGACVEATAMVGFMLDYDIVVVADCCGTTLIDQHETALKKMAHMCATIAEAKDVVDAWRRDSSNSERESVTVGTGGQRD
jgi:ureidoacrylate peracid hydrolase